MANTQEIKTVSYREFSRELHKLQSKYENSTRPHILIHESDSVFEDSSIQLSVNWSSIGSVSPEEARKFAHTLLEATKDCENFKYNGYVIDWSVPSERN